MNIEKLTADEKLRRDYIKLLIKSLKYCKNYSPNEIIFSLDEEKIIEYHLKNVAHRAVLEDLSTTDCVALFVARVTRLADGENEEWVQMVELVRRHRHVLLRDELVEIQILLGIFTSEKVS